MEKPIKKSWSKPELSDLNLEMTYGGNGGVGNGGTPPGLVNNDPNGNAVGRPLIS